MAQRVIDRLPKDPEAPYFSFEFFPPKTSDGLANLHPRLSRLARLNPLFVAVTWGAGGSTAHKSIDLATLCQQQYGLTTCLHLTCTNMRQRILDDALERCKEAGIRNVLALRGDEPRDEYRDLEEDSAGLDGQDEETFEYAIDLVRYIRRKHGDYFCIGVAGYPEGHATNQWSLNQSVHKDLPYLRDKVAAGADFIMTQLFYDTSAFLSWQSLLRSDSSGLFKNIPIMPGLMPVQSWGILTRTTKLSCAKVPEKMMKRYESVKGDDEKVKEVGVDEVVGMIGRLRAEGVRGFHFYTLNLEKAVADILELSRLVEQLPDGEDDRPHTNGLTNGAETHSPDTAAQKRPLSARDPELNNRVVVDVPPDPGKDEAAFEATEDEAGMPSERPTSKSKALAVAEGQGSLGREATWDDYPNGRFGDARSPAFNIAPTYSPALPIPPPRALSLWGQPTTPQEITHLFARHLNGTLSLLPWSEGPEPLSAETKLILPQLQRMNSKGWWSIASQPGVNCVPSSDEVVGWGPRNGWVWQKPFVEFFLPSEDWKRLRKRLADKSEEVVFFAANAQGEFISNHAESVNPVTWGAFRGKEIVTPTIIEAVSFRAWSEEAFELWRAWGRVFPRGSKSATCLEAVRRDVWLVNCIGNEFVEGGRELWEALLDDG
ncbi:MAG: hypothetical protein Q9162_000388 [Coniocarpon cinnabarinum]